MTRPCHSQRDGQTAPWESDTDLSKPANWNQHQLCKHKYTHTHTCISNGTKCIWIHVQHLKGFRLSIFITGSRLTKQYTGTEMISDNAFMYNSTA